MIREADNVDLLKGRFGWVKELVENNPEGNCESDVVRNLGCSTNRLQMLSLERESDKSASSEIRKFRIGNFLGTEQTRNMTQYIV